MDALRGFDTSALSQLARHDLHADAVTARQPSDDGGAVRQADGRRSTAITEQALRQTDQAGEQPVAISQSNFALRYRGSSRTTLLIETQQGDTVRLKIRTNESLRLDAAQLEDGDQLVRSLQLQNRSKTQIKIVVNGDLNADEMASIRSVIDQAGDLASEFFNGDLQNAFQAASALQIDGQQLASVGLKLRMKEQITYTQQGVRNAAARPPAEQTSQHPAVAADAPDQASMTSPAATTTGTSGAAAAAETDAPQQSADNPSTLQPSSFTGPLDLTTSLLDLIADFLARLADAFDDVQVTSDEPVERMEERASVSLTLKFKIFESVLVTASEIAAAEVSEDASGEGLDHSAGGQPADTSALVSETIEALAASRQPTTDAVA